VQNLKDFAPHIHVLYREIPFILNIIATSKLAPPTVEKIPQKDIH